MDVSLILFVVVYIFFDVGCGVVAAVYLVFSVRQMI